MYSYYEFYNPCTTCPVTFFLDVLSPTLAGVERYVDYSRDQAHLRMPTEQESHFKT